MDDPNLYQEIPSRFYSFETKQPFEVCIECECYLLDDAEYIIEKAIRKYEGYTAEDTVFDYAICMNCAMKMRAEFSKESLANIDAYFASGFNFSSLLNNTPEKDLDIEQCLNRCIIKSHRMSEIQEFQIYAYCKGSKLSKKIPPYMVSSAAIDEILPLLSKPTTDFLDGFYDRHFSPDPSLMQPDPSPKLVFI